MSTQGEQRAVRAFRQDAPLYCVIGALLVFGVVLRAQNLGVPTVFKWDEHHYVETARAYVHHQYAWNDHPPLSKLIIATFMYRLGDKPFVWRLPSLLFGIADIGLIAWLTQVVWKSNRAAWIAAAFVAADGFFIAYSRTALLDGMIVAFGVTGLLSLLVGTSVWNVVIAGLCVGCAISFKLNGLAFFGVGLALCLLSDARRKFALLYVAGALLVFYAQGAYTLWLVGREWSIAAVIRENREMVHHHLSYTVVHPFSSHWYTWFLPVKPIYLRRDVGVDGMIRALLTLGNPLLWWGGIGAVLYCGRALWKLGPRNLYWRLRHGDPVSEAETPTVENSATPVLWTIASYAAPIVFWFPSLRDSYIYHYMPSYAFALVLLAGVVELAYRERRLLTLVAILCVANVSVLYAPLWGELPITQEAANARLPFPSWR
jgi:dolichyl-phosphate-mannose--protein O-mannosyl transferase